MKVSSDRHLTLKSAISSLVVVGARDDLFVCIINRFIFLGGMCSFRLADLLVINTGMSNLCKTGLGMNVFIHSRRSQRAGWRMSMAVRKSSFQ